MPTPALGAPSPEGTQLPTVVTQGVTLPGQKPQDYSYNQLVNLGVLKGPQALTQEYRGAAGSQSSRPKGMANIGGTTGATTATQPLTFQALMNADINHLMSMFFPAPINAMAGQNVLAGEQAGLAAMNANAPASLKGQLDQATADTLSTNAYYNALQGPAMQAQLDMAPSATAIQSILAAQAAGQKYNIESANTSIPSYTDPAVQALLGGSANPAIANLLKTASGGQ
jgi:hypothetical protein